ncbi:RNA polymerase sigma-70 factor [Cyclobacterium plantarum]|uniref:RNA polymerase sigma-70 factor n=1 Tax=Cyclobacterium plantarum TaxID=2716263 RepID=A0ABX0H9I0_9BACT|nr:RNA polymerase sigma-70 factor [Cyclobacterium plantarum]NHE58560.1 RNA polymerase sigma-70 factor [Cyclobacterium plantarum]
MDTDEVKTYYLSYFRKLVLFACKYVGDMDLAQDLVQDVFVSLLNKPVEKIENPDAFFYTATKRKCLDHIKTQTIRSAHHENILSVSESVFHDDAVEKTELENHLLSIINELPGKCKEIFLQSRFEGKSNLLIAEEMQLSKRTVETQISKALKKIREGLTGFKNILLTIF